MNNIIESSPHYYTRFQKKQKQNQNNNKFKPLAEYLKNTLEFIDVTNPLFPLYINIDTKEVKIDDIKQKHHIESLIDDKQINTYNNKQKNVIWNNNKQKKRNLEQ